MFHLNIHKLGVKAVSATAEIYLLAIFNPDITRQNKHMRKTREMEQVFKSHLKTFMVADPQASLRKLRDQFIKNDLYLDLEYISKIRSDLFKERAHRMDRRTLNMIVAEYEDTILVIKDMCMKIATTGFNPGVRMQAMSLIHRFSDSLFDRLIIAGALDKGQKRLIQAKVKRVQTLPKIKKQSILASMFNLASSEK